MGGDEQSATAAILVVDDDRNVCDLISSMLGERGYRTVIAGNGSEALAYLHGNEAHPGLILLDLMMPVMNGWDFRRVQQCDPSIADIPVAIITGMPGVEGKASAIGAVDVLYKPSRVESLASLAFRFCGRDHRPKR